MWLEDKNKRYDRKLHSQNKMKNIVERVKKKWDRRKEIMFRHMLRKNVVRRKNKNKDRRLGKNG